MGCPEGIWWELEEKDRGIDMIIFHHIYEIVKDKENNKNKKLIKYISKENFNSLSEFNDHFSDLI